MLSSLVWALGIPCGARAEEGRKLDILHGLLAAEHHYVERPLPATANGRCLRAALWGYIFSRLDLASGYWQIAMAEDDRDKTAICTHKGLYWFRVMPLGCNAPSMFKCLMDAVLEELLGDRYLDDIAIFGDTFGLCQN